MPDEAAFPISARTVQTRSPNPCIVDVPFNQPAVGRCTEWPVCFPLYAANTVAALCIFLMQKLLFATLSLPDTTRSEWCDPP